MARTSPGIDFLLRQLLRLGFPPLLLIFGQRALGLHSPTWLLVLLLFSSVPLYLAVCIKLEERRDTRKAAELGARLAPEAKGTWLANFDILTKLLSHFKNGYPGRPPIRQCIQMY